MYALGGFKLIKFLIDSKQVLQFVDEADKRTDYHLSLQSLGTYSSCSCSRKGTKPKVV